MNAELVYAFTHTLLRDAAYQLQLPADRSRLHRLALEAFESWLGVPPLPQTSDAETPAAPHPSDPYATELADHAALCDAPPEYAQRQALYLLRAAMFARRHDDAERAAENFLQAAFCNALDPRVRRHARLSAVNELVLCGKLEAAEGHIRELCALAHDEADIATEVRALHALAGLHWNRGRLELAEEILASALTLAQRAGRPDLASECRGGIGILLCDSGRASAAMPHLQEALAYFRSMGAQVRVAVNLGNLALCCSRLGDFEAARRHYEEALTITRREGARRREGMLQCGMADLLRLSHRPKEAQPCYLAALKLLRLTGDRRGEVIALNNFANLLAMTGRPRRALALRERAYDMAVEMGNPLLEQLVLTGLAKSSSDAGRPDEAIARYHRSIEISRVLGHRLRETQISLDLGDELLNMGRYEEARPLAQRALELCDAGLEGELRVRALVLRGLIDNAAKDLPSAERSLLEALAQGQSPESARHMNRAHVVLALIEARTGRLVAARIRWRRGMEGLDAIESRGFLSARVEEMRRVCAAVGARPFDAESTGD